MDTNQIAKLENIESATAILLALLVIIIFYGLIDAYMTHKEEQEKKRLDQEISYLEQIESLKQELAEQEELVSNSLIIPKGKRSEGRTDWIELPDEGACLQALPAPTGE